MAVEKVFMVITVLRKNCGILFIRKIKKSINYHKVTLEESKLKRLKIEFLCIIEQKRSHYFNIRIV